MAGKANPELRQGLVIFRRVPMADGERANALRDRGTGRLLAASPDQQPGQPQALAEVSS
jgi:hypothetical protein